MNTRYLAIFLLTLIAIVSSCKSLSNLGKTATPTGPKIDFTTPADGLNVKVSLDAKQTSTGKIGKSGGSVSLTAADGSKFLLDLPANAVNADTAITMTVVKSLEGSLLENNAPSAVQLEPSGLLLNEIATLTVVPGKDIPLKQQIAFGYEGDGKDYHLAVVDPKSRDIKIRVMQFSGAGVGSGSDAAWAANLQIQAATAATRLEQKTAEIVNAERMRELLGDESQSEAVAAQLQSLLEQYYDQVVLKELASAELDCRYAERAIRTALMTERQKQLLGYGGMSDALNKRLQDLAKTGTECKKPASYQIVGGLDDWQTNTKVCNILEPFTLTGLVTMRFSGGLSGTYTYGGGPFNANGKGTYSISLPEGLGKPGTMTGGGSGQVTGDKVYTGRGVEKYTLTPVDPCE